MFIYEDSETPKTPSIFRAANGAPSTSTYKQTSSIDNRKFREIENSVRGMTIFRQKFDESAVYRDAENSIMSTRRENNVEYETDQTVTMKSANFSQMRVEVNPFQAEKVS